MGRYYLLFVSILCVGFFLRIYAAQIAHQELIWDMQSYSNIAQNILKDGIYTDCCHKSPGYPLFLAGMYTIFGIENLAPIRTAQILLDLCAALLLYVTAKELFSRFTAMIVFILYCLNPLTSSYTGLILPEILTLLVCSLFIYSVTYTYKNPSAISFIATGFIAGILIVIRLSIEYGMIVYLPLIAIYSFGNNIPFYKKMIYIAIGCFIAFSYPLVANYRIFHTVSLGPPYAQKVSQLYLSYYIGHYPELIIQQPTLNPTFYEINRQFNIASLEERSELEKTYTERFWIELKKRPGTFIMNSIRNAFWLWDKDHLSAYTDPYFPSDRWGIRIGNILLIFVACSGYIQWLRKYKNVKRHPLSIMTLLFFLYITGYISLVSNETRHSLFYYPLIFLWAGYGMQIATRTISNSIYPKK